jgi:hypothetical protein
MPNIYENVHTKALTEGDRAISRPQYNAIFVKVGYAEAEGYAEARVIVSLQ